MANSNIHFITLDGSPYPGDLEIIERKGKGHPDTLADGLAEELSRVYSNYTLSHFGAILHHNFDKLGLMGGSAQVAFGHGQLIKPIRVLINGRASGRFANQIIPLRDLLEEATCNFIKRHFPHLDTERDLEIWFEVNDASSPGYVAAAEDTFREGARKYWFTPRGLHDLPELNRLAANDAAIGCSYAPLSATEKLILTVERRLNETVYRNKCPWLGSDIKVMAVRIGRHLDLTLCVPQIADYTPSIQAYRDHLESIRSDIMMWVRDLHPDLNLSLHLNTRDDYERCELYLTAIGSSIESGDEGLVGRGNRINGLISALRPMNIEGICGKNPVYHAGKLYSLAAYQIAQRLYEMIGCSVEVYLISQSGRTLQDPWKTIVVLRDCAADLDALLNVVEESLRAIPSLTDLFVRGKFEVY